jgi:hypothetical protein
MVRAINRVIGSEIEERTLSAFDYGSPAPRPVGRPKWRGKTALSRRVNFDRTTDVR